LVVGVDVISQGGSARRDGLSQSLFDRAIQPRDLVERKIVRWGKRMDPGEEEALVGVDVSEAGDDGLVEECRLDRPPGTRERGGELGRSKGERLRTEAGVGGTAAEPEDATESARVAKP
jgi:hypothetical protein